MRIPIDSVCQVGGANYHLQVPCRPPPLRALSLPRLPISSCLRSRKRSALTGQSAPQRPRCCATVLLAGLRKIAAQTTAWPATASRTFGTFPRILRMRARTFHSISPPLDSFSPSESARALTRRRELLSFGAAFLVLASLSHPHSSSPPASLWPHALPWDATVLPRRYGLRVATSLMVAFPINIWNVVRHTKGPAPSHGLQGQRGWHAPFLAFEGQERTCCRQTGRKSRGAAPGPTCRLRCARPATRQWALPRALGGDSV